MATDKSATRKPNKKLNTEKYTTPCYPREKNETNKHGGLPNTRPKCPR